MPRIALVVAAFATALTSACAPRPPITENSTGAVDGRFYTFWHDSGAGEMRLGRRGAYTVNWRLGQNGNLVAGVGWEKGTSGRVVRYVARSFEPGLNGYLTLYGWSRNPLVEYYIVESWGHFDPPGNAGVYLGSFDSDGGAYRIYRTRRVEQPSILGTATFDQYWSVRTEKRPPRSEGTITFANHVRAWESVGLRLGALDYQVLASEGFGSEGRSDIRVWE